MSQWHLADLRVADSPDKPSDRIQPRRSLRPGRHRWSRLPRRSPYRTGSRQEQRAAPGEPSALDKSSRNQGEHRTREALRAPEISAGIATIRAFDRNVGGGSSNFAIASECAQCCICKFISSAGHIMLSFRLVMIQSDPTTTRNTMRMPNASASTLLALSGPVVMCRKKTR